VLADWALCTPVLFVIAATIAALSYADFRSGLAAVEQDRRLVVAGRDVFVVRPADPLAGAVMSRERCDSLNDQPAVLAAGGLVPIGAGELDDRPGTSLRLFLSTGSVAKALDPGANADGTGWIAVTLAAQLGIADRSEVSIGGETLKVTHFDPSARTLLGDLMLLVPSAQDLVAECWVSVRPGSSDAVQSSAMAALYDDTTLVLAPVLEPSSEILSPAEQYGQRSTRYASLVAGVLLAMPLVALLWFGRSSWMLYRTVGTGRLGSISLCLMPHVWMLLTGSAVGISTSLVLAAGFDLSLAEQVWQPAVLTAMKAVGIAWAVASVTAVAVAFGDPISQLKS